MMVMMVMEFIINVNLWNVLLLTYCKHHLLYAVQTIHYMNMLN